MNDECNRRRRRRRKWTIVKHMRALQPVAIHSQHYRQSQKKWIRKYDGWHQVIYMWYQHLFHLHCPSSIVNEGAFYVCVSNAFLYMLIVAFRLKLREYIARNLNTRIMPTIRAFTPEIPDSCPFVYRLFIQQTCQKHGFGYSKCSIWTAENLIFFCGNQPILLT